MVSCMDACVHRRIFVSLPGEGSVRVRAARLSEVGCECRAAYSAHRFDPTSTHQLTHAHSRRTRGRKQEKKEEESGRRCKESSGPTHGSRWPLKHSVVSLAK
jgi:hypothetical protein